VIREFKISQERVAFKTKVFDQAYIVLKNMKKKSKYELRITHTSQHTTDTQVIKADKTGMLAIIVERAGELAIEAQLK